MDGNGHRRMNFYHKKSSRMGRSSSMERPGKLTSSLASAELFDYKLTEDILYENKMKEEIDDDSHDTILLNMNSKKDGTDQYFIQSQNLLNILQKTKNYFEQRDEIDRKIINTNKYVYKTRKYNVYKKDKQKKSKIRNKINRFWYSKSLFKRIICERLYLGFLCHF